MLTVEDFPTFFYQINGHPPFAWQTRLLHRLTTDGRWPTTIDAPTGSGKSSMVEIHAFAVALSASGKAPRLPRRLSVVVNRRALVDAHEQKAQLLHEKLLIDADGICATVARSLAQLTQTEDGELGPPLVVGRLRGGTAPDSSWIDDVRACAVVCATPDMWGSRLLFHGYGSTRLARPREAGALALDSVVVIDEAHLNRQLVTSARAVAGLVADTAVKLGLPGLSVVETTATPTTNDADTGDSEGVQAADLDHDEALARRLTRPKPVSYVTTPAWTAKKATKRYVDVLVSHIETLRRNVSPGGAKTIGCVVNRVATAVQVSAELQRRDAGLQVRCWVGRLRPIDLDTVLDDCGSLLSGQEESPIDVLVATQTVEVGVDLDLAGLVTELASGSALAQRAGRVNRIGTRATGPIVVIGPEPGTITDQLPYLAEEMTAAQDWIVQRSEQPAGLSPWALVADPPPPAVLRRTALQHLSAGDVDYWTRTNDDLFEDPDLSLWLRDDLEADDPTCGIVIRDGLPSAAAAALSLLQATPPHARETFPVGLHELKRVIEKILTTPGPNARIFNHRDAETRPLAHTDTVHPGDVLMIDSGHPIVVQGAIDADAATVEPLACVWGGEAVDVILPNTPSELIPHRLDRDRLLSQLVGLTATDAQKACETDPHLDRWQVTVPPACLLDETAGVPALPWLVCTKAAEVASDEETRQSWNPQRRFVTLDVHASAVARRARRHASDVGLTKPLVKVCELAGQLHDEGKRDPRFQVRLAAAGSPVLAKGAFGSAQESRRASGRSGLPQRWRHEQLSVVHAAAQLADSVDTDLVLRLIGTSHGHGRATFPHSAAELLHQDSTADQQAIASRLFDEGEWDELIERTTWQWGPWGCSYLETLLRAADCQVSKEGS